MVVTYRDKVGMESYWINDEEVEGLSDAQTKELIEELKNFQVNADNVYDVICKVRDYLSYLNP